MKKIIFHVITLFPEAFESYIGASIIGRAVGEKKIQVKFYNPRSFVKTIGKNGYIRTDGRPYGAAPEWSWNPSRCESGPKSAWQKESRDLFL